MALGTVSAARAAANFPLAGMGGAGNVKAAWGSYAIASAPAANDVIQMCRTPANATIIGGWVIGDDIDTGTETLDFDAGYAANGTDAADTDAWGNFGVVTGDVSVHLGTAGIYLPFQGVLASGGPKTLGAETVHQILFNAAANAGGTGRLTMVVLYTVP
jgi:hypothetical protein